MFVSDLRKVGGFLWVLRFPTTIKQDIFEILFNVALNTIILTLNLSVTCDRSVDFSKCSDFLLQYNWPPRYNWNIVESGVKHHNPIYKPWITRNKKYDKDIYKVFLLLPSLWKEELNTHMQPQHTINYIYGNQYLTTIVIQSRRAASCYSWFYYS